jgi:hypothetical protein
VFLDDNEGHMEMEEEQEVEQMEHALYQDLEEADMMNHIQEVEEECHEEDIDEEEVMPS